jgi:DNA repair protein RecN (Recombination protein N)
LLYELTVRNFGIIEEIAWGLAAGFNVITGETGAGKSLVVDAVESLLTGQASEEDIRHGSEGASIEGVFHIHVNDVAQRLNALLSEKGLDAEKDTLLISGDFRRQGRTTPRINRQAVSRSLLRDISAFLVDIHGQSGHLSLLNKEQHLNFLDAYAHTGDLKRDFGEKAAELTRLERELQALTRSEQDIAQQKELLNFQIEEISRADLTADEDVILERELVLLTSAEKLKEASYEIYGAIYGEDNALGTASVIDRINQTLPLLKQIVEKDPSLRPRLDAAEEILHGLEELAREIRTYGENLEYDPQRLEEVQVRLELIRNLKRKYGGSIIDVLSYLAKAERELEGIDFSTERSRQIEAAIKQLKVAMGELAWRLYEKRNEAGQKLSADVQKELADLNMSQVEFAVDITHRKSTDGIPGPDGELYMFTGNGIDDAAFLAATNPGEPLKPLDKIASTGEISRFMLALKSALAEADTIPVLIFDEIDIGIGGRSGEIIGRKLWKLSRNHQVICVTHLPQIAAFADVHYRVSKQSAGDRTISSIEVLDEEGRLNELAVMIAGPRYSENSLEAARELIGKADNWKEAG